MPYLHQHLEMLKKAERTGQKTTQHPHIMWVRGPAGPSEGCTDMAWHPARNTLVTVTVPGRILIWAHVYKENWTAFAPDFRELEQNEVCICTEWCEVT